MGRRKVALPSAVGYILYLTIPARKLEREVITEYKVDIALTFVVKVPLPIPRVRERLVFANTGLVHEAIVYIVDGEHPAEQQHRQGEMAVYANLRQREKIDHLTMRLLLDERKWERLSIPILLN